MWCYPEWTESCFVRSVLYSLICINSFIYLLRFEDYKYIMSFDQNNSVTFIWDWLIGKQPQVFFCCQNRVLCLLRQKHQWQTVPMNQPQLQDSSWSLLQQPVNNQPLCLLQQWMICSHPVEVLIALDLGNLQSVGTVLPIHMSQTR